MWEGSHGHGGTRTPLRWGRLELEALGEFALAEGGHRATTPWRTTETVPETTGVFEIDSIVGEKRSRGKVKVMYLVQWAGYNQCDLGALAHQRPTRRPDPDLGASTESERHDSSRGVEGIEEPMTFELAMPPSLPSGPGR